MLCTLLGESQQSYFPGLTRGLVAVVLYYDGKVSLVNALRLLIQARQGRIWLLPGVVPDVVATATKFTDQIMAEGMTAKILGRRLYVVYNIYISKFWES